MKIDKYLRPKRKPLGYIGHNDFTTFGLNLPKGKYEIMFGEKRLMIGTINDTTQITVRKLDENK